ncbi:intraflagellar transport 43 [Dermatophagoides farinae]|uniref:Intraflagellar transport protein 43 n=1 Tax=Dermatophagoides farinae TaxID=6954 RepID=A0A922IFY4_DERFA|nr:intraflagellar transport protein 43 homolog [Dermatophagoides farinae]KAH9529545.1 Intraflagellar transport protein 43 [Dermatophagoides farinae]
MYSWQKNGQYDYDEYKLNDEFQVDSNQSIRSLYVDDDDDEYYPNIPDVEDLHNQEFMKQTAMAPASLSYPKLNTIELTRAKSPKNQQQTILSSKEDKELSTLLDCLLPRDHVEEDDATWSWDSLMTEIMNKMKHSSKFKVSERVEISNNDSDLE